MIAIPAIDLRGGACVQLVGGSFDAERVRIADPLSALRQWEDAAFDRIHIVDLDAAAGRGTNAQQVDQLLAAASATIQVGGGIRATERVDELLGGGADHVVVGTRALEDPAWLDHIVSRYPGRIIVAADVRERSVVTQGWARTLPLDIRDVTEQLNAYPLAGLLVTAVHVEGQMAGPDVALMRDLVGRAALPVIASGGIASMSDLRLLADEGVAAAVIGMALYTGVLDPRAVAEEFAE
jgi:phosphoribosylformimino-5-aminoimidazole carboxamide ribotide isomerase